MVRSPVIFEALHRHTLADIGPQNGVYELIRLYPRWLTWFGQKLTENGVYALAVKQDGELSAFFISSPKSGGNVIKLDTFFVLPHARKQGLSALLWERLHIFYGEQRPIEITFTDHALPQWQSTLSRRGFVDISSAEERQQHKFRFCSSRWFETR